MALREEPRDLEGLREDLREVLQLLEGLCEDLRKVLQLLEEHVQQGVLQGVVETVDVEDKVDMEDTEKRCDPWIRSLIVTPFSGVKDEFGKESVPPLPLLLSQISERQPPRSEALFFDRLPSEMLVEIVQCIEPSSLASFALVSRDCLHLAHSVCFASVLFDYSDSSVALINKLLSEGEVLRHAIDGSTLQPPIGTWIRRITVATNFNWLARRHGIILGDNEEGPEWMPPGERLGERIAEASRNFFELYLPSLMGIFALREILPNLELLDWKDKISLPQFFLNNLACSSIKYLKLDGIQIDEDFEVEKPILGGWPLRSLHLHVHWNIFGKIKEGSTSNLCASILRLCTPTLTSLAWHNCIDRSQHFLVAEGEDQLQFPCLRELRLKRIKFLDSASLDALLWADLVSLIANTEMTDIHSECFKNRGEIFSLTTFVWETIKIPAEHPLDFLQANWQLSKLSLPFSAPPVLLKSKLLHLLSKSFKNLCSLCLVWDRNQIPSSALPIIGTIESLQQVHLSAGEQFGLWYDWLIDHTAMRRCPSALPNLKRVAFSQDSYDNGFELSEATRYYIDKYFSRDTVDLLDGEDVESEDSHNAVWERLHRERMLREVDKYVKALPKLNWLYFGQLPMSVEEFPTRGGTRRSSILWEERDDCLTQLKEMFGGLVDFA